MSLVDHLYPDTECADYGEHPRYWRYQDFEVEVHRYDQRGDSYEGSLRVNGSLMAMVGPDTRQKVARELEKILLSLRPGLRAVLYHPKPKSALERIVEEVD